MIYFNNTEIAFAEKDKKELSRSYFVFSLISNRWHNKIDSIILSSAFKLGLLIKGIIKSTVFEQFCGGESIADCESKIQELSKYRVQSILDYSVEGKQKEEDFKRCLNNLLASIKRSETDNLIPFCVVKLTALFPLGILKKKTEGGKLMKAEFKQYNNGLDRIETLSKEAFKANTPLLIDAEESWVQDEIDAIALKMKQTFNKTKAIIFNTAQLYRHDRLAYIHQLHERGVKENFFIGLKIVRGAYKEKERVRAKRKSYPSPIQANKENTDRDFDLAIEFCVNHTERTALCCGTHNEKSTTTLIQLMKKHSITANTPPIFFSQLLGMSDHISFNLAQAGYKVAKYVSLGPLHEVTPYLIRRSEENTSVVGQCNRDLQTSSTRN